jgi:hypothetical protein
VAGWKLPRESYAEKKARAAISEAPLTITVGMDRTPYSVEIWGDSSVLTLTWGGGGMKVGEGGGLRGCDARG